MKHHPMIPIFWLVALIFLIGLACTMPTSQPSTPPGQTPDEPGGGVINEPPEQSPTEPSQPSGELPPAPTGMVAIPAGNFQMGWDPTSSDKWPQNILEKEIPLHTVYLDGYYIDIYEVTNNQYAQCVATGVCDAPPKVAGHDYYRDRHYGNPQYGDYPVTFVSWYDAENYCIWAGKSLPTEAQWEKAARGSSDTRMYPWGNTPPDCSLANFRQNNYEYCGTYLEGVNTAAVGSHPDGASPYGAMDMAGNVAEYVQDWMVYDYYSSYEPNAWPANPVVSDDMGTHNKVFRGGGWPRDEFEARVSFRSTVGLDGKDAYIGFRCASSP